MLRDCHDPLDLFALVPKLGLAMDPILTQLDRLLDDEDPFQQVTADLAKRSPQTAHRGRPSTPAEVILRMRLVKRLYRWSYAETGRFVADSLVLRQFCRVYLHPVPDDATLLRWANRIEPQTLERLNDRVVALAHSLEVTRGRRAISSLQEERPATQTESKRWATGGHGVPKRTAKCAHLRDHHVSATLLHVPLVLKRRRLSKVMK